ncbi:50S ribosomal protein L25/general stress protein Ctc [Dietzia psychralcaliphila]|uniref:Large ribosomal subunit protein bL25 n=1 Tax=Dietzia psychralcaliphila TaxID=139021 RepID=A0AAD0JSH0_9ACTN|nr:50S ribosomal protein L25/general stress protein Ctc [Dietzia psychralcaliphila]AWH96034.1 50S ribosomal protein L25/general stress protein Ctc [Dietzia psychralcaliphila]PTM90926.1 LSU ribosomal protein L25P [Dietzia psychralcaliphila]
MAKEINNLKTSIRTEFGKGSARRARREGQVPAVLYGHHTEPRHLLLNSLEFAAVLRAHGTNSLLTLDIEGEEQLALPKQIDVHPLTRIIEHTDLLVVRKGEKVTVEVSVTVVGDASPGTLVTQDASYVEIEADATLLPEGLEVSVEDAEAGLQITAADIDLPAGSTLISDPETLIVNVIEAPSEADLEAEEEAAPQGEAAEDAAQAAEEA